MGPDGMPMPAVTGEQSYANGDAEIRTYSILEVSHDWDAKEVDECSFFDLELMRSKWELLAQFSGQPGTDEEGNATWEAGPLDEYRDTEPPDNDRSASSVTAAEAIEAVTVPSGIGRTKKPGFWRWKESWRKPALFEAITDKAARKIFKEHFPHGLYVARVGSKTVDIDDRAVAEEWTACRVGRGEKIIDRPLGADGLPIQRAINDLLGIAIETVLRAIPQTLMDSQLIDRESYNKREAVPSEVILATMTGPGSLSDRIAQMPVGRLSDQNMPLMQAFRAFMQEIPGIRPELSGGGAPTQTYREAKQRKDQALQQLSPQADEMRYAAECIATILVKLRAKYGSGTVKAQRKGAYGIETDVADIAALRDSGWHVEADDNFPMTLSDRRDNVWSLLKEAPPELVKALELLDPMNIAQTLELFQMGGYECSIADQKAKTIHDIQALLQEQPMPGPPGPDGKPTNLPSIQPDKYDDAGLVSNFMAKWLRSQTGQKAKISNSGGFDNVEASYEAYAALAAPPLPPPPPPIKGTLSLTAKAEDFPNDLAAFAAAAGVTLPPPATGAQPASAAPSPAGDLGSPQPLGSPAPVQSPIPPLPGGPQGPQPMPVQ